MNLFEISIFISVIQFYGNIIARQRTEDIINISYCFLNLDMVFISYEFLFIINNHKTFLKSKEMEFL